jgi:hypothetical protein
LGIAGIFVEKYPMRVDDGQPNTKGLKRYFESMRWASLEDRQHRNQSRSSHQCAAILLIIGTASLAKK